MLQANRSNCRKINSGATYLFLCAWRLRILARDAVNKFLRLNLPVSSHDDILIQQVFASRGNYGDVFFIISDAEQSKEILEVAQTAKNNGSTVISF